jgi:hypothetical protein
VDILESARGERRRFMAAAVLVLMVGILAPPAVNAAAKAIKVKVVKRPVKVVDTTGDPIESSAIPPMGSTQSPGSAGALAVRTFAGGGALLGAGVCGGPALTLQPSTTSKVTAIIITGTDGIVDIQAPGLPGVPPGYQFLQFRVTADNPNVFVGLGNGLTVHPAPLQFTCTGPSARFVVLGQ